MDLPADHSLPATTFEAIGVIPWRHHFYTKYGLYTSVITDLWTIYIILKNVWKYNNFKKIFIWKWLFSKRTA